MTHIEEEAIEWVRVNCRSVADFESTPSLVSLLRRVAGEQWADGFKDGIACPPLGKIANPWTGQIVGREPGTAFDKFSKPGEKKKGGTN